MESAIYLRNIKITPKKLRFMVPGIRTVSPAKALEILRYIPKRSARMLYKAIKSAVANAAQTLGVDEDLLKFKVFSIDEGQKLKRYNPGSKGTTKPFQKKSAHIKIVLVAKRPSKVTVKKQ